MATTGGRQGGGHRTASMGRHRRALPNAGRGGKTGRGKRHPPQSARGTKDPGSQDAIAGTGEGAEGTGARGHHGGGRRRDSRPGL